jgi:hypothetical protein
MSDGRPTYSARVFSVPWEGKHFLVAGRQDGAIDFVVPDVGSYPLRLADAEALIVALCSAVADVHRGLSLGVVA